MKFKRILLITVCLLVFLSSKSSTLNAATDKYESGYRITDKDGNVIIFDPEIPNGGITLQSELTGKNLELSKSLEVNFQTQQRDYWGGPASISMILDNLNVEVNQETLAEMLKTDETGTNAGNHISDVLNHYIEDNNLHFQWVWHNINDTQLLRSNIVEAINLGKAVLVDTVEEPGEVYLVGHDLGKPYYHYGLITGYKNFGTIVEYTDPGFNRINGFEKTQEISIEDLSKAISKRGYAW